jgi:transcription initiation factor TFIIB
MMIVEEEQKSSEQACYERAEMLRLEGSMVSAEPKCDECLANGQMFDVVTDEAGGIYVCTNCGLQLGSRIITTDTEWRSFEDDGSGGSKVDPNRVGAAETGAFFEANGLASMIDGSSDLALLQNKSMNQGLGKSLLVASNRIEQFVAMCALTPFIGTQAKNLFKMIESGQVKMKKIKNKDSMLLACVHRACQDAGFPRQFKELSSIAGVDLRLLKKAYARIKIALKSDNGSTEFKTSRKKDNYVKSTSPMDLLIPKISMLKLDINIEKATAAIIEKVLKDGHNKLGSTTAPAIVGAAIYKATQASQNKTDRRSFDEIANVVYLSVGTIRSVVKKITSITATF